MILAEILTVTKNSSNELSSYMAQGDIYRDRLMFFNIQTFLNWLEFEQKGLKFNIKYSQYVNYSSI